MTQTALTALTLLILSACAPAKVITLHPPGPSAFSPPVTTSEGIQDSAALPPEAPVAMTPPTVGTGEISPLLLTMEPTPVAAAAEPEYHQSFASYYAKRFNGRHTASGERYDPNLMTAATRDFPLHSWLKIINPANGKEVTVRVNDLTGKRKTPLVDLSRAAAKELGFLGKGKIRVQIILLPSES